jgi:signal peptidase II
VGSATDGTAPVSYAERSLAAGLYHWLALVAVALAALVADQTTKEIVLSQLGLGEAVHVVGPLSLHHVQNSGIAFGLFSAWGAIVTLITGGAVVWMLVYFARAGARHPVLPVALGLLIGGSAGNLADRIRLGHVTDFVDLRYWPAFNLADTFICVGVAVLLATALAGERAPRHPRRPRRAAPERA